VLANAEYVAALTHRMLGLPPERVLRVPHWIDRPPFGGARRRRLASVPFASVTCRANSRSHRRSPPPDRA
jgi:hypothetical protein